MSGWRLFAFSVFLAGAALSFGISIGIRHERARSIDIPKGREVFYEDEFPCGLGTCLGPWTLRAGEKIPTDVCPKGDYVVEMNEVYGERVMECWKKGRKP